MKVLKGLNIAVILLTLVAYLAPYMHPGKSWFIAFLGLAYPGLLLANLGFVGLWAFSKKRFFLLSLITILLGWYHLRGFIGMSFQNPPVSENAIKVMSYNLHYFNFYDHEGGKTDYTEARKRDAQNMLDLIVEQQPDILFLQELGTFVKKEEIAKLQQRVSLPHFYERSASGIGILSKFPLEDPGTIKFEESANAAIYADVILNGQKVRLYNLHLQSLKFEVEDYETITQPDPNEKDSWNNMRGVARKVKVANTKRAAQANQVVGHLARCPHPILLGGDFNDTPSSYTYRLISENLQDSFKERGRGMGHTYAGPIPAMRIDYVMTSPAFNVLDFKTVRKSYSDHYPIVSTLSLQP